MKRWMLGAGMALAMCGTAAWSQTETPDGVVDAWAAGFNGCSASGIAALYDASATLWGTNASSLITTPEGVRAYFNAACGAQPPITVRIGERTTRAAGNWATSAGVYVFTRGAQEIPARFSFAMSRQDGRWLIVQHHSSLMPGRP